MVTMKSGTPSPTSTIGSKAGAMKVREGSTSASGSGAASPNPKLAPRPATRTAMVASAGLNTRTTRNRPTRGRTRPGCACALSNTPITNRASTPASMAAAIAPGMLSINRPIGRKAAASTMRAPATRNAPTAAWMPIPLDAAISAAPGVDQAVTIGIRWRALKNPAVAAMLRHRAATQDEVCAASAPTALAASRMIAIVLPKPIRAATIPETTMDRRIFAAPD